MQYLENRFFLTKILTFHAKNVFENALFGFQFKNFFIYSTKRSQNAIFSFLLPYLPLILHQFPRKHFQMSVKN